MGLVIYLENEKILLLIFIKKAIICIIIHFINFKNIVIISIKK